MAKWFDSKLSSSLFPVRTGTHVESRPGSINFSILGRQADHTQRQLYKLWDSQFHERVALVAEFNELFPDFEAYRGGETDNNLVFFGDAMDLDGNDYPLAKAILTKRRGVYYTVSSWRQTYEYLEYIT
jgi:phosphomannomutase